jgi:gliding motility-associated lipoprotein GldH
MKTKILGVLLLWSLSLLSCTKQDGLKEINDLKDYVWEINKPQVFKVEIKDINKPYSFKYLIRNAISYPYYNIYIKQKLIDPTGAVVKATTEEIMLFDPKTGKPNGDGLGDIFDHKIPCPTLRKVVFPVAGTYKWELSHNMRPESLAGVMSIGAEIREYGLE